MFWKKKSYTCNQCGATVEPEGSICPSCGCYVFTNRKEDFHCFEPDSEEISGLECYVFGTKLSEGEYPIRIGRMAYHKSVVAEDGWLVLTNQRLLFISLKGKLSLNLDLENFRNLANPFSISSANMTVQDIKNKSYSFKATEVSEWVEKINEVVSAGRS